MIVNHSKNYLINRFLKMTIKAEMPHFLVPVAQICFITQHFYNWRSICAIRFHDTLHGYNIPVVISDNGLNCHWNIHKSVDLNNLIIIETVCLPQREANRRVMKPVSKHNSSLCSPFVNSSTCSSEGRDSNSEETQNVDFSMKNL